MKENDLVAEMFEEIMESLTAINKKLEIKKSSSEEPKETIQKQFLEFVSQTINKSIRENVLLMDQSSKGQLSELKHRMERLDLGLKTMTQAYNKRRLIFRKLIVWQSITVALFLMGIGLYINNRQLKDNDLKFRYIQNQGGVNSKGLQKLDTIFHVNRDELAIEKMRERVKVKE